MKIRIISGAVLTLVVAAILTVQLSVPIILVLAVALAAATGVFESLYTTGILKNKTMVIVGMLPALVVPFSLMGYINISISVIYTVYVGIVFVLCLKLHSKLNLLAVTGAIALPIVISYGFSSLCFITQSGKMGIFYLLLILCWSAISDTGAYFVGVMIGRHKMAKIISPKKSWEGLIGGVVFSIIFCILLCLLFEKAFGYTVDTLYVVLLTPLFVLIGVMGDLSASLIKRKCSIKDFGKIIPGHGGIMDRFDSILMISPFFMIVISVIQLIK